MKEKHEKFLIELNGLINEGQRIIYDYNPDKIKGRNKLVSVAVEAYSDYIKWNYTCCPLLHQNGFIIEGERFNEISDIGIRTNKMIFYENNQYKETRPYSDATQEEAEKLLNYIKNNTDLRLKILNEVRDKILHRTQISNIDDQKVLWIDYPKDRMIIINNKYRLRRPRFNSTNDKFFSYLIAHQNQMVSKIELKMDKESWSIHQCLRDLGFINELQRAFFPEVSNNSMFFRNPVKQKDLKPFKELMNKILQLLEQNSNEIVGNNRNA